MLAPDALHLHQHRRQMLRHLVVQLAGKLTLDGDRSCIIASGDDGQVDDSQRFLGLRHRHGNGSTLLRARSQLPGKTGDKSEVIGAPSASSPYGWMNLEYFIWITQTCNALVGMIARHGINVLLGTFQVSGPA